MYQVQTLTHTDNSRVKAACSALGADAPAINGILARRCHVLASVLREPVLRKTLTRVAEKHTLVMPSTRDALGRRIDHTLLDPMALPGDIARLCHEAAEWHLGTVSVNSRFVSLAARLLEGTGVGVCASVAFPFGASSTEAKIAEARSAVWDGATEIDMVLPIGLLKARRYQEVFADMLYVRQAVERPAQLRVVLETSLLTTEEMADGAFIAMAADSDSIKTSTGFLAPGPSPADVRLLRGILGGNVGIKAAGNIHTWDGACTFFAAGASRVSTTGGIEIARGFLESRSLMDRYSALHDSRHISTVRANDRLPAQRGNIRHHETASNSYRTEIRS